MSFTPRLALLFGTTALCALPLATSSRAQQPDPGGAIALPTLEIEGRRAVQPQRGFVPQQATTGTKTDTPLIETPQAISVITRDQMDMRQVQSLTEAMRYTPGIRADAYGDNPRY